LGGDEGLFRAIEVDKEAPGAERDLSCREGLGKKEVNGNVDEDNSATGFPNYRYRFCKAQKTVL
jgi:hypothetical protein